MVYSRIFHAVRSARQRWKRQRDMTAFSGASIELASIELNPVARRIRDECIAAKGSEEEYDMGYPIYDWQRQCFVFEKLRPGQSCLEIGPGRCYLSKMIAESGMYERVCAIDIVARPRLPETVDFSVMSVGDMSFPDSTFDTVICTEVLEHLDDETLPKAIAEIRRVCRAQLIVSVPYNEPLPLPKYHKQQFTEEKVRRLFPNANYTLLLKKPVMRVPWMLIEEEHAEAMM